MDTAPTRRSSGRKPVTVTRFDVEEARQEQAFKAALVRSEKQAVKDKQRDHRLQLQQKELQAQQEQQAQQSAPTAASADGGVLATGTSPVALVQSLTSVVPDPEKVVAVVAEVDLPVAESSQPSRSSSAASFTSKESKDSKTSSSQKRKRKKRKPKAVKVAKAAREPKVEREATPEAPQNRTAGVSVRPTVPDIRQELGVNATDFVSFIADSVGNLGTYTTMATDLKMAEAKVQQVPLQTATTREKRGGAAANADGGKRRRTQQSRTHFEDVPECPTYHPTAMEFAEPLDYIASIRKEAEKFGICRIVPPPQWEPTCQVSEHSDFSFHTRLQNIHRLFKRNGPNRHFLDCLREHLRSEGSQLDDLPEIGGVVIDLYWLSLLVGAHGGLQSVINTKSWGAVATDLKLPRASERDARLQACYYQFLLSYDMLSSEEKKAIEGRILQARTRDVVEEFGYGDGPEHTMASFKKYADDFKTRWFGRDEASLQDIAAEYWSIVDKGDKHVGVCYGSDVDTTKHGSGFPTDLDDPYSRFGWNLNVLPGLEGSILKHVSGISGISMPWLYVGMLFSTFAWHNEDNYLYSINYHHFGAPKQWYGVPGSGAAALEASFRSQMPDEFEKRPLLLHDLVTMVSPEILRRDGVEVCQTVQEAGHFVVTFPQSYHSGFSYGFNCGEAVNFASADWIPYGHRAIQDYSAQRRPVSLNQEHLILSTARLERNVTTLSFTVVELEAMCKREATARTALVERGVRKTTFEIFSGGQSRDLGSANIFQQRLTAKMSVGRMGRGGMGQPLDAPELVDHAGGAGESPVDVSAVNTKGSTLTSPVCEVCSHVCHISMVVLEPEGSGLSHGAVHHKSGQHHRIRCMQCTLDDATLGAEHTWGWTSNPRGAETLLLVSRYSLEELQGIIAKAHERMGGSGEAPGPGTSAWCG
eukprot:m.64919 g.64919  ORF g.64919 m.64919 type:complete len:928 (-) comp17929_c0_seq1:228-3011(-)